MQNWNRIVVCIIGVLLLSCKDKSRENALLAREKALAVKEKQFYLKEQDYQSLLRMRDSIIAAKNKDSFTTHWPPQINGMWNSKLVCIASACNEYVIGDQKTNEIWNFTNDSLRALVAILNNNKLVRVYTGKYDSSYINMYFKTDTLAKKPVQMDVTLSQISGESMKGIQTITIDTGCTAKFSVELSHIRNN